jgi:hypothetical protein
MKKPTLIYGMWCFALALYGVGNPAEAHDHASRGSLDHMLHGSASAAVSFTELQATVDALNRARGATEKYQDVRAAEADGYRVFGPYVRGQGFHYVNPRDARGDFDVERPPILLYEKDESAPQGLRLVGVSYLLSAPAGPNGQPVAAPFPLALATWHKHNNICLFPDRSVQMNLQDSTCQQYGGRFIADTDWMVHAWIWKDSPAGVFSATNPEVH